jgi:site-specific recombinase XerD
MENPARPSKLLDQVRALCAAGGYSTRTANTYADWARRFILANGKQHPATLGRAEVVAFLAGLQVGPATRAQARAALVFLYRRVLALPAAWLDEIPAPRVPQAPVQVLSSVQVLAVLARCGGPAGVALHLMGACGLRLSECCALRLVDVDLSAARLLVHGKGQARRVVPVPASVLGLLAKHVATRQAEEAADVAAGFQASGWLLAGRCVRSDGLGGPVRRQALPVRVVQREIEAAAQAVGVRAHCHVLRHSYASALVRGGVDLRSVQTVLGHADIRSTVRYVHTLAAERVARVDVLASR